MANEALHEEHLTFGTFLLGELEFGVELLKQREVLRMMEITRVPCATSFVEGVINLRGAIIPIINLRKRFGMEPIPFGPQTRIINIEITDTLVLGFVVDKVGQVCRLSKDLISPPPAVTASVKAEYLTGIGKVNDNLLLILNISKILSLEDIRQLESLT